MVASAADSDAPKVSIAVVVPAFNVENYVRSALNSVLAQTREVDEVIVIDDGSTDGTPTILAEYKGVPGWRIVRTRNNGLGPARNLGRALAKSDYIYFFDSDDLLKKRFIERVHEVIEEYQRPDMMLLAGDTFYDDGFQHSFAPKYNRTLGGAFERGDKLITELAERGETFTQACLYVTKAAMWSENRVVYPPILHEDEAVLFPLLAASKRTIVIPEAYFQRRVRPDSIMTRGLSRDNAIGVFRVFHETKEFMAREPELVQPDVRAWRKRLANLGLRYLDVSRAVGLPVSWGTLIALALENRDPKYPIRLVWHAIPAGLRTVLRRFLRRGFPYSRRKK